MTVNFYAEDGDLFIDCGTAGCLHFRDTGEPGVEVQLRKTMRGLGLLRKRDPYTVKICDSVQGKWLKVLSWAIAHYHDKRNPQ